MAKRREPPAGGPAAPGKAKDKDRELPAELVALGEAVKLENRPELSGSASGAFTYALMSGACWALDHHAQPDQGSRDVIPAHRSSDLQAELARSCALTVYPPIRSGQNFDGPV